MRVAIYARFSSELQSGRSIEDQVALCADYAGRRSWTVVDTYADYAVSGASVHGRYAFERLISDARAGRFTIILAEDLDRLSRNQADIASLYERMAFASVEIWTVADGRVSEMHIGLKGTMSALFLKSLAQKTHRGLQGRVREGKSAGGRCYGYRVTGTGEREIVDEEAAVVRRVFEEYVAGRSPRDIVARLNREGIPGPRGGEWNASTINGSKTRGNGVLRNELYVGRIVWNRQRFLKDPDTGKRVSRPNDAGARQVAEVPLLRIVEQEIWDLAQGLLERRGAMAPQRAKAPRHVLSGLCRCGSCGGSFVVTAPGKFGCSSRRERGTCDNRRMISIALLERRVLAALSSELLNEEVVSIVTAEYIAERKRLLEAAAGQSRKRDRRMGEIDREVARIVDFIASTDGIDRASVAARLRALQVERAELEADAAAMAPELVALHPRVVDRYRAMVANLQTELASRPDDERIEAVAAVRSLIDKIVIYDRTDSQGRDIDLIGTIAALLGGAEQGRKGMSTLVAGAGFEPAAFRL